MVDKVIIGNATLFHADCRDVLGTLEKVNAVITDPPYSARTHEGHDRGSHPADDLADRKQLNYSALSVNDVEYFAKVFHKICSGWIVWMSDHILAPDIGKFLEKNGRYVFAPLPFFQSGRSVSLAGDGPCSWTDWIIVARNASQHRWGTLPGGYIAGPGWNDKARMGGKPTLLMEALVRDYSKRGDIVLDTHMGAGTTGVACVKNSREFIGIEIEKEAFDIACSRIEEAQKQISMFDGPGDDYDKVSRDYQQLEAL